MLSAKPESAKARSMTTLTARFCHRLKNVEKLADFFRVSKEEIDPRFATLHENVIPVDQSHLVKIPLIGHIACGEPITADQNVEGYITEYFPESVDPDSIFALKCEGDSMEPYILDGDIATSDSNRTLKTAK